LIEMAFRLDFLHQADEAVDDCHAADGDAALDFAEVKQGDGRRRDEEIEQGEDVAAENLEVVAQAELEVRLTWPRRTRSATSAAVRPWSVAAVMSAPVRLESAPDHCAPFG